MNKIKKIQELTKKFRDIQSEIDVKVTKREAISKELAVLLCKFDVGNIVFDRYNIYIVDEIYIIYSLQVGIKGRRIRISGEPEAKEPKLLRGYTSFPETWTLVREEL